MVIVTAPSFPELEYTLGVVLGEFLGLEFIHENCGGNQISLCVDSDDKQLSFSIVFLQLVVGEQVANVLPSSLSVIEAELSKHVFGLEELIDMASVNNLSGMTERYDIFGVIFFMLSRVEELIESERDGHDRFTASSSFAKKVGFLQRPIVDEYVELLWSCMKQLWPELERKRREPKNFISCDVDTPFDPSVRNAYWLARTCFADVVKRRSVAEVFKRIRRYNYNKNGDYRFDPNYTFDWYMDICEQVGLKAAFYFIPTSVESQNGNYELSDPSIRDLLLKVDARGHEIGLHGSYQTFRDGEKLKQQKALLDNTLLELGIKQKVKGNRQHYLRWDSSITPDLLDEAGFEYDTTGGYADHAGFRFGTCHEFSMWSWQKRSKLNIKQRPLVVMECSVIGQGYMGLSTTKEAFDCIKLLKNRCSDMNGDFSLLWHNSSFITHEQKELFQSILDLS